MSIFTYEKLYRAYLECRKNKRKTINALRFELDFENNLIILLEELKNKTYVPGQSICFVARVPKPREIFAADFRDRVVHHFLVREIEEYFEKRFIYDSYACRKEKGTHKAVGRLKYFMGKKENRGAWYLKMDIKSFFVSIDHEILYKLAKKSTGDEQLRRLLETVVFHKPARNYRMKGDPDLLSLIPAHKSLFKQKEKKGLPIGNHSSQFFANVYLNELDQFVKRELHCRHYIRYVDDFILISGEKSKLFEWKNKIEEFLKDKLDLSLSENKTMVQPLAKGVDFLGYFIKPDSIHPRRSVFGRYKDKLFQIAIGKTKTDLKHLQSMNNSYIGHFNFKGKIPAGFRDCFLTFTERAELPASIPASRPRIC